MEKLELKQLKGYLGTGLKCYAMGEYTEESTGTDDEKPQLFTIEGMNNTWIEVSGRLETVNDEINIEDCIPLLLPLSALTEPLEDGSVPIVELAKIATGLEEICVVRYEVNTDGVFILFNGNIVLGYCNQDSFGMYDFSGKIYTIAKQLQLFEYLYSKHFDIHRRIPAGLAIDKRTIK